MALRTSSLMVSIFSSALFLAFSLGGFSFEGALSSVGSVGSVLAGAGFGSAGLVSVDAGIDGAFRFRFVDLGERVSYDVSLEISYSELVSGFRDI